MASNTGSGTNQMIWIGIAAGAAVGIVMALTRKKRSGWDAARDVTRRMASQSGDFADATKDLMERMKIIYEEGRRVVEDAAHLWEQGRRLVRA
jgi:LPXTG-motif cell wall-anchored protein